jgi:Tfp pilus assembly protein FimT
MTRKRGGTRPRPRPERDRQFGLPDLVVVLLIFGLVTACSVPGLNRFLRSLDLNKQVQRVATMLRVVRQKAITDNRVYVVWWNPADLSFSYWNDENDDGKRDEREEAGEPVALPAWVKVDRSETNPFPSDSLRFLPDGSASASGSLIFANSDGYARSLSVVRLTGMVTVQ